MVVRFGCYGRILRFFDTLILDKNTLLSFCGDIAPYNQIIQHGIFTHWIKQIEKPVEYSNSMDLFFVPNYETFGLE